MSQKKYFTEMKYMKKLASQNDQKRYFLIIINIFTV